jgi:spermidine synthase
MTRDRLIQNLYFATVFLTGAAVLIFEVAAVRMLSPYYGSSLSVFSSVLSVVLGALSLGYYLGGRLADRSPHFLPLYLIISAAGLAMLALLWLALNFLPSVGPALSFTVGPLLISLALFFIPAFLLGIDSPFVVKLLSLERGIDENGATVGSTFFWSTVGSIVGSFMAGFVLIPQFGLTETLVIVSVVLIAWSISMMMILSSLKASTLPQPITSTQLLGIVGIIITLTALVTHLVFEATAHKANVIYHTDGYYSGLTIYEQTHNGTTYRFLKSDLNNSSAIIPGSYEVVYPYAQLAFLYPNMVAASTTNYLVLGGGAYTMSRHLHAFDPALLVDTVEIEPKLLDIAYTYFELQHSAQLQNHAMDARVFLAGTTTLYDVMYSDVMNTGYYIPPHLSTAEFFSLLKSHLAPDGIAFINFIGTFDTAGLSLTGSMYKTIESVFPNLKALAMNGTEYRHIQNIVFIVRNGDTPIVVPDTPIKNPFDGSTTTAASLVIDPAIINFDDEVIFTDNHAPVEALIWKQLRRQPTQKPAN